MADYRVFPGSSAVAIPPQGAQGGGVIFDEAGWTAGGRSYNNVLYGTSGQSITGPGGRPIGVRVLRVLSVGTPGQFQVNDLAADLSQAVLGNVPFVPNATGDQTAADSFLRRELGIGLTGQYQRNGYVWAKVQPVSLTDIGNSGNPNAGANPPQGPIPWLATSQYTVGTQVIYAGQVYNCIAPVTVPGTPPPNDPARWMAVFVLNPNANPPPPPGNRLGIDPGLFLILGQQSEQAAQRAAEQEERRAEREERAYEREAAREERERQERIQARREAAERRERLELERERLRAQNPGYQPMVINRPRRRRRAP